MHEGEDVSMREGCIHEGEFDFMKAKIYLWKWKLIIYHQIYINKDGKKKIKRI